MPTRPRCAACGKPEHPTEISRLRCQVRVAQQRVFAAQVLWADAQSRLREAIRQHREPRTRAEQQKRTERRSEQQQRTAARAHMCSLVDKLVAKARSLEQIGQPHEAAACKAKVRELVARHSLHAWYKPGLSAHGRFAGAPERVAYECDPSIYTDLSSCRGAVERRNAKHAQRRIAEHEAWLAT